MATKYASCLTAEQLAEAIITAVFTPDNERPDLKAKLLDVLNYNLANPFEEDEFSQAEHQVDDSHVSWAFDRLRTLATHGDSTSQIFACEAIIRATAAIANGSDPWQNV